MNALELAFARRLEADRMLAYYDFSPLSVKDTGCWQDRGGGEWSCAVLLEGGDIPEGRSAKVFFVVRFREGTDDVADYYMGG